MKKFKIFFTKSALKKIYKLIYKSSLKFRIYISSGGCNGLKYGFKLEKKINKNDFFFKEKKIKYIIDSSSIKYLFGSEVDYIENLTGSKFIINNPNIKNKCSCGYSFKF